MHYAIHATYDVIQKLRVTADRCNYSEKLIVSPDIGSLVTVCTDCIMHDHSDVTLMGLETTKYSDWVVSADDCYLCGNPSIHAKMLNYIQEAE